MTRAMTTTAIVPVNGSRILAEWNAQRQAQRAATDVYPLPGGRGRSRVPRPYQAAISDRLTASWLASRQSINDELRGDLDALRERSRDVARNNAYARKFLKMVARNVVGPKGFVLQARAMSAPKQPDTLANAAVELGFFNWAKRGSADITGRLSFNDLCRVLVRGTARDGEALVHIVRGDDARNREGLALQLIDIARLDTQRNRAVAAGKPAIVMGIEIDQYQRPLGYWVKTSPEAGSASAVRYDARDMLHLFVPEDSEQLRGRPWMHAAMLDTHDLGEFNRSALLAARKGANTLGFIVSPTGEAPPGEQDSDGTPLDLSVPGSYDVLPEGYDIRTPESQFPNTAYDPFVKAILRRISSGLDVSYNSLANDLEGVNFSSIRAGVLEERDEWSQLQNWFIDAFLEPVFDEWFPRAMAAGTLVMDNGSALPLSKAAKFSAHEWQGRRWQWVDPLKDIEASRQSIRTGIASPQMIAAQNGVDVEDVLDGIATFERMVAAQGIQTVSLSDKAPTTAGEQNDRPDTEPADD